MFGLSTTIIGIATAVILVLLWLFIAMLFRVVVPTNEVHIVQSRRKTVSFGKDQPTGNTYYKWPSWIPRYGVKVSELPTAVFSVPLNDYAAYDKGRLPFMIDIMAFFRISDSNLAAQRVSNFVELRKQLEGILQGACRTILATNEIEQILEGRGQFGAQFTQEVDGNLAQWGVQTVKQIELMDIRDSKDSKVIWNIMAKKSSEIDRESRVTVAQNRRAAEIAEAEAIEKIGQRNAEKDKNVGIAEQQSQQAVQQESKTTMERTMEVRRVEQVQQASINKDAAIIQAEQSQRETVIKAQGEKERLQIVAEGTLVQAQLNAKGIEAEGTAKGVAQTAILMAPIDTQIKLAKEIGENKPYQEYLISVRSIEKDEKVGIEQAKVAQEADIKVYATGSGTAGGIKNALDLISPQGGVSMGAMVDGMAGTEGGAALLATLAELMNKLKSKPAASVSDEDDTGRDE